LLNKAILKYKAKRIFRNLVISDPCLTDGQESQSSNQSFNKSVHQLLKNVSQHIFEAQTFAQTFALFY
jgi:hypothetical protein